MGQQTRRSVFAGALALSGMAATGRAQTPAQASPRPAPAPVPGYGEKRDVVMVHGAWSGAYGWIPVVDRLYAQRIRGLSPCLTGAGERRHLIGPGVNLTTHVMDIVNEVEVKDLRDIVLVGHSYGGMVITGVAERIADRIGHIIYVDAFVPRDGQSVNDITGDVWPARPGAPWATPPRARREGDSPGAPRQYDAPTEMFTERLHVTGAYQRIAEKTYILATRPSMANNVANAARLRAAGGWTVIEVPTGHGVQREDPDGLTAIIARAATRASTRVAA